MPPLPAAITQADLFSLLSPPGGHGMAVYERQFSASRRRPPASRLPSSAGCFQPGTGSGTMGAAPDGSACVALVDLLKGFVMRFLFRLLCCSVVGAAFGGARFSSAQETETTGDAVGEKIQLFNEKNLEGWSYHLRDSELAIDDVWSVENGMLRCKGKPVGYLITKRRDFENYVLDLEWRWP
ncbi:MAG: family 16 glycoside hydrolase, partial [Aeoliella sp.]